jgi:hypothetical protein
MKTKLIFFITLFGISLMASSQSPYISGKVKLDSSNDDSHIRVVLERIAPSLHLDTTYTDTDGVFLKDIDGGIYNIYISKDQYFTRSILAKPIYSGLDIGTITLQGKTSLIEVPADISSIQQAIDIADKGDTVLISEGIYKEKIIVPNKEMVIASTFILSNDTSVIAKTIIDGNFEHRVIEFNGVSSPNCQLIGLTIRNGVLKWADLNRNGPGIWCWNSNPTLKYLIIEHNENLEDGFGGGIYCLNSKPVMDHLIIRNNKSSNSGGGIYLSSNANARMTNLLISNNRSGLGGGIDCRFSSPEITNSKIFSNSANSGAGMALQDHSQATIENVLIYNNTAEYPSGQNYGETAGGGIYFFRAGSKLTNVSIINNKAQRGSGMFLYIESNPTITNSLVAFNKGKYGIEINPSSSDNNPSISFCNFYGNDGQNFFNCNSFIGQNVTVNINKDSCDAWNNIQEDPRLSNPTVGVVELTAGSPCIDAGNNKFVTLKYDLKNIPRILSGHKDATPIVDIGYLEYDARISGTEKLPLTDKGLHIYPNPFTSLVTYRLLGANRLGRIEILEINGKVIYSEAITSNQGTIDVEKLRAGIYLFRMISTDNSETVKIIKR